MADASAYRDVELTVRVRVSVAVWHDLDDLYLDCAGRQFEAGGEFVVRDASIGATGFPADVLPGSLDVETVAVKIIEP